MIIDYFRTYRFWHKTQEQTQEIFIHMYNLEKLIFFYFGGKIAIKDLFAGNCSKWRIIQYI